MQLLQSGPYNKDFPDKPQQNFKVLNIYLTFSLKEMISFTTIFEKT